mmetsp:Transcript_14066/g.17437  ORF Transcript_14066/g.17437 Transcript_14066/m.17437 type:complete len:252 (+) Transcript_14066:249-1004(+)
MFAKASRTLLHARQFQATGFGEKSNLLYLSNSNLRFKNVPSSISRRRKTTTSTETKIFTRTRIEGFKRDGKVMARSVFAIGFSLAMGDCLCQVLENGTLISYERTATMFTIGTFITGPLSHTWNIFLETKLPGNSVIKIVQKTLLNSVYAFNLSLPVMFTAVTLLSRSPSGERGTFQDAKAKIAKDLVPTFIAGCFYWPAFNFLVFRFVAANNRAVASSLIGTVWNVYLAYVANKTIEIENATGLQQRIEE